MFILEAFTEQGGSIPETIFQLFTGILVIVCSTDIWNSRKLTMRTGVKDSLVRSAVLIPECGI